MDQEDILLDSYCSSNLSNQNGNCSYQDDYHSTKSSQPQPQPQPQTQPQSQSQPQQQNQNSYLYHSPNPNPNHHQQQQQHLPYQQQFINNQNPNQQLQLDQSNISSSNSNKKYLNYQQYTQQEVILLIPSSQTQQTQTQNNTQVQLKQQLNQDFEQKQHKKQNNSISSHYDNWVTANNQLIDSNTNNTRMRNFISDEIKFVYSEEGGNSSKNTNPSLEQTNLRVKTNNNNNDVIQTINHTYYGFNNKRLLTNINETNSNQDIELSLKNETTIMNNSLPVYISQNFNKLSRKIFINQYLYKYGYGQKPIDTECLIVNKCTGIIKTVSTHNKCQLDSTKIQQIYIMVDILHGIVCYYIRTYDKQVFQKKCILDKWRMIYNSGSKSLYHSRTLCLENIYNCFRHSKWFQGKVDFLPQMFLEETIDENKDLDQFKSYQVFSQNNSPQRQFIQLIPEVQYPKFRTNENLISDIKNQQQACLPVSILGKISSRFGLDFKPEGVLVFELEPIKENSSQQSKVIDTYSNSNSNQNMDFLENLLPDIYIEYHPSNYNQVQDKEDINNLATYLIPNETTILSSSNTQQYRGQAMQLCIQQRPFDFGGNVVLGFPINLMIKINEIPSSWVQILNSIFYQFKNTNNQQIVNNTNQQMGNNQTNTASSTINVTTSINTLDKFETLSIEIDELKKEVKLILQKKNQKISSLCSFGSNQLLVYKEQHNEFIKQKKWFIGYNSQLYILI